MNNEKQICYFAGLKSKDTYSCGILNVNVCNGNDAHCSFFKTAKSFSASRDKAIDRCREKGLCSNCKYVTATCVKSGENKGSHI